MSGSVGLQGGADGRCDWAVILMPGFFSPRWMLRPMRRGLSDRLVNRTGSGGGSFDRVTIWDNAVVFKPPAQSVDRLVRHLGDSDQPVALVTHSFGDWIARQAVARLAQRGTAMPVKAIVSLAPVWIDAPAARLAAKFGGRRLPEIAVMSDPQIASASLELPSTIARLVIWATFEPWVRPIAPPQLTAQVQFVTGTHNSIVVQRGVWDRAALFLRSLNV